MTTTNSLTITCPAHHPERCSSGHRWVDHLGTTPSPSAARRHPRYGRHHTQPPPRPPRPRWPASARLPTYRCCRGTAPDDSTRSSPGWATRPSSPVVSTASNTRVCRGQAPKALSIGSMRAGSEALGGACSTRSVVCARASPDQPPVEPFLRRSFAPLRSSTQLYAASSANACFGEAKSVAMRRRWAKRPALLLRLHDHEMILAELVLAEREEHLDEEAVGNGAVGDDDRLRARRIEPFGFAHGAIGLPR